MKPLVHESRYPGLTASQFRRLMADNEYQDAVAKHGKIQDRLEVRTNKGKGSLTTSWVSVLHRTLEQKALRPLRAIWSKGVEVKWRETHSYQGHQGTMRLDVLEPAIAQASVVGAETLLMQGSTLVRRIEVDVNGVKLPIALRFIPGVKKGLASEVERGLTRADECTLQWLKHHPNRYDKHVHNNA